MANLISVHSTQVSLMNLYRCDFEQEKIQFIFCKKLIFNALRKAI